MLLSGLEIQPLFATLAVLLDNCSSLFDCWSTLGAAAAAAVGAGAAAVFVGGLLLNPGEGTGIIEEGVPPVATGTASTPPATFEGGGVASTVAQAPPPIQPQVQAPAPAHVQPQVQPPALPQVQASPQQVAPVAQPAAPHVDAVQPGPVAASSPVEQPAAVEPATAVETGPVAPSASPGAATPDPAPDVSPVASAPAAVDATSIATAPTTAAPDAPAVFDTGLAAGLASGVAPVASAIASVASSRAGSSGTGQDSSGQDHDEQDEDEVTCPEADASLFGLPDINTRQDCPGTRPGMPPNYAGIDFTSNDDRGRPMELPFEAGVTGQVTYVGGAFNSVQVTLENGNRIQFLHASQVLVQVGQQVEPTTILGRTGGTGPYGPNHYEIHLHVQAFDPHGDLIDPDCALSGGENRRLRRRVAPPEPTPSRSQPAPGATTVLPGTQPLPPVEVPRMPVQAPVPVQAPTPPPQVTPQVVPPVMPQFAPQAQAELRCTRCGNLSPAGALFCPWCGQTFARAAAPTQAPPASPPAVPPASAPPQVIYCGNCGQANDWGAAFCGRCGTKLAY
ncbi:MAG: zinc ribbon domain-containing protein [Chloroflexota bacterium]|nr:zinc ribbon domain-containing protein [Chloroflexota bacterium]MDQ5864706.1 zinc ribbon domain-containing protein [Chloroflexota bacterium]